MSMNNTEMIRNPVVTCGLGRTKQSFEAETNINNIMAKYKKTGEVNAMRLGLEEYRDISEIPTLHECMNIVAEANSRFMELPVEIRAACDHNAGNFLAFVDDPDNRELCDQFELFDPKPISKIVPTPQEKPAETAKPEGEISPNPDAS